MFLEILYGLFLLFDVFFVLLCGHFIDSEPIQDCVAGVSAVGEVHGSHLLIVDIFDGEVDEESSVGHDVSGQVDFLPRIFVVNVVLSPLFLPLLKLEGNWEGS